MLNDKPTYKRHADDEWFDEIRISVVPRYKTSGLSGDEWRVSAKIEIFRKGVLLKERYVGRMEYGARLLDATIIEMADEGFTGSHETFERLCFQPGCKAEGVVEYRLRDEFYAHSGDKMPKKDWRQDVRRRFCEKHALRGDCGLEDADVNYEVVLAPPGWSDRANRGASEAASPSAVAHVVVNSLDDIPGAIKQVREGLKGEQ